MTIKLTAEGVRKIFPSAPQVYLDELVKNQAALAKAGILETRPRLAYCFANVEHESGGFTIKNLTENINYTPPRVCQIWPNRYQTPEQVIARFGSSPGWQLKMFDEIYGSRMGNRPGTRDGSRYIGRGACQHTGRDGYAVMEKYTGIPLVDHPELASKPEHQAALIAAFWTWKGLNKLADAGDFNGVVRRWNGGQIGMADRKARMAGNAAAIAGLPEGATLPPPHDLPEPKIDHIETAAKELPTKKITAENVTAGTIAAGGIATAAQAHQSGMTPGRITMIVAAFVVVAIAAFVAVRWIKRRK